MTDFPSKVEVFVEQLDAAVEAHLDLTQRVLRCAVLRVSPGDDVLSPQAHTLCGFGCWFNENKAYFIDRNPQVGAKIERVHSAMHDAIRSICRDVLADQPGQSACLDTFEQTQSELVELLADFKTQLLATAAQQDSLTGLPLRHSLEHDFAQLVKTCYRNKTLLYVAMIDIDHFKAVNDNYGHPVGDEALRYLADTLKTMVRSNEQLYRYGGEEFILLLQTDKPESMTVPAQRLLEAVRQMRVPLPTGESLALTVTLGLARVRSDEGLEAAVERADQALYAGKTAGRDRYVFADD
jgi:diguanylate cyclase (GGDEF)-like protein